jgi:hypothetical protein
MESKQSEKFLKAQKRVNDMKKFYRHLRVYIIINVLLIVVKLNLFNWFKDDYVWMQEKNFSDWASINLLGTPIIWGIGLAIHGLYVFKFKSQTWQELKPEFIKKWEKRQLEKFLREENKDGNGGL